MIVERFKNGDAAPVYRRFREHGRMAPDGVTYISSWVDENMRICFQVMQAENVNLIHEWISHWNDIVDFEIYPVITSQEAARRMS
jgi:Protein of unknown function (DUF3303)